MLWRGALAALAVLVVSAILRLAFGVPWILDVVASRLLLLLPGALFSFLLDHLLTAAKPLLLAALAAGWVLAGAGIGWLIERRHRRRAPATGRANARRLARRALVLASAAVAGAGGLAALLARGRHGVFATEREAAGVGPLPGAAGAITPTDRFYVVSKNFIDPSIDPRRWRLEIGGLVRRPLALSLEALKALPIAPVEQVTTLCCISNPVGGGFVSTARWRGLPLGELLDYVQVKPGASWLHCWAADGYSDGMATAFAREPGVLVAWEMNGAPLTRVHGAPVRLLVPGRYGLKSVKWLTRMELLDAPAEGFWRAQGWSEGAEINTFARLDWPDGRSLLHPGLIQLRGIAFAGRRGIAAVEVSLDGGRTWAAAQLEPLPDATQVATWVPWTYSWQAVPGAYTAAVRAIDGTGAVQEAMRRPPYPSGSTGYHTVSQRVVEG